MCTKSETGESYTNIYSGQQDTHHRGVALIMNKQSASTLKEWETINERLIKARFNSKYCKLTIIQCYAPTNDYEDEMKEHWYKQKLLSPHNMIIYWSWEICMPSLDQIILIKRGQCIVMVVGL